MVGIRSIHGALNAYIAKPRFAAKLVLTPIQLPHREQASKDMFLVNPADNESETGDMALVFPTDTISLRQRKAVRVSLP